MIETYARQVLRVTEAHAYYSTGEDSSLTEDLYVGTLVDGLRERFGTRLTRLDEWRTGRRLTAECGYRGLLLFAGRWSEFDGFLRALKECGADPPRHLVADDSVNRYMANPGLRASAPGNLPVTYVSKASLATCAALRAAQAARDDARGSFLDLGRRRRPARPAALPRRGRRTGRRAGQPRLRRGDDGGAGGGEPRRPAAARRHRPALGAPLGQPGRCARRGAAAERRRRLPGGGRR